MDREKYTWYKLTVSDSEIIQHGSPIRVVEVNGKKICLARFQHKWFGFAYTCPHSGGILADGFIDAKGNIVCPLHSYRFNIQNGRNSNGEDYLLKTYPVVANSEGLFLGMENALPAKD